MTHWTATAVRQAASAWVWTPDGAQSAITDFRMINYPEWLGIGTQVSRFESEREPEMIIADAIEQARSWGRDEASFWVTEADRPPGMEQALLARGARQSGAVTVLACELTDGLPDFGPMPGVTAERVLTHEQRDQCARVNYAAWGTEHRLTDGGLERELALMEREFATRGDFRVLGRLDGTPICAGGCTVVDGVARLWGAATIASARGRGGYRAVLAERIRIARQAGATLALVKGRIDTSAPILERIGFADYGQERIYALDL